MAYLDGVAADFLRTLPPSAVEATRREIAAAITAVHDRLVWLTHTLLDERAARAKAAPHQPPSGAETELAALFDPPPAPESP